MATAVKITRRTDNEGNDALQTKVRELEWDMQWGGVSAEKKRKMEAQVQEARQKIQQNRAGEDPGTYTVKISVRQAGDHGKVSESKRNWRAQT